MSESAPAPNVASPRAPGRSLDRALLHGLAWTGAAKWATQLVSWASTLIVARLLTPEDYGLVGMAGIYLGFITLLSEFGLGGAVVTLRELDGEQISQLNGLAVLFGVASFLASCAIAVPLGHFFRAPQLPLVVVVMSTTFVIAGFKTMPLALLQRDLRFKALALVEASQAVVLSVAMVAFAMLGFRYWTLVIGAILSVLISTLALWSIRHTRLAWPRLASLRHAVAYSSHLIGTRLCWYAYSNADFAVAGRVLGKAALGVYDFGWTLANIPVDKVTALVGQVTPAFFSTVQTDIPALRRYFLHLTEGLALVAVPLGLGLAVVGRDLVMVALGPKWEGAVVPLQLLAIYAGFRCIMPLFTHLLLAIRDSRFVVFHSVALVAVMPAAFFVAAGRWGTAGLGMTWVLVYPVLASVLCWRVFRKIELPALTYLRSLWPALSSAALMAVVAFAAGAAIGPERSAGLRLVVEVGSGAVTYCLACLLLHRRRVQAFYDLVVTTRARTTRSPLTDAGVDVRDPAAFARPSRLEG